MASLWLKPGREHSLRRRHPWVFSGAVERMEGASLPGETVDVYATDGALLARGAYSPSSQISVRIWSFDPDEAISGEFFRGRLERALKARRDLGLIGETKACRLVFAESDGLPGLIVDRYGTFLVCQFLSAGAEYWKKEIVSWLERLFSPTGIFERSDADVREKEGLLPVKGVLSGKEPPPRIEIEEGPCRYLVDVRQGHKTGFYLDQRDNRSCLAELSHGADVLDCFSYTGPFSVRALRAGAGRVTSVESSAVLLENARQNILRNGLDAGGWEAVAGDVFQVLRSYRDSGRRFDVVVLDPPKFVESKAQIASGSRGYKDINLLAFKLLRPGGFLLTFSCSGLMMPELFQKIVSDAALDSGREAQIIRRLFQSADHPTLLSFPEGTYLKGLVCRVW